MPEMTLTLASWADRQDLVIEIEAGAEDFGLVTFDDDTRGPVLEIYPRDSGREWRVDLDQLRTVLERADRRIRETVAPASAD